MDQQKVKKIIQNIELLLDLLKKEMDGKVESHEHHFVSYIEDDVDEYYSEDDDDV